MASDASVKRVEELNIYSSHLQGFCDSMVKNGTAYSNLMVQKLEELARKVKQAESIVLSLKKVETVAENELAYRKSDDKYKELLASFKEKHDDLIEANRLLADLKAKLNVAQGAVRIIIDETKGFQDDVKINIEQGRKVLRNATVQLEQYKELSHKI